MFITALCPTYRRPALLANSVKLWEMQDYPAHLRRLIILDDGRDFANQKSDSWDLFSVPFRFDSLPGKFNALLGFGLMTGADALLAWEDDDVYLPGYVSAHAAAFARGAELSKPGRVWSDYSGGIAEEPTDGRFHSTIGFSRSLALRIGGWPQTRRADFDQQFMSRLAAESSSTLDPWRLPARPEFVFSWHTGHPHGQSAMRSPDDETWYDRSVLPDQSPRDMSLAPRLDERTVRIFSSLGIPAAD